MSKNTVLLLKESTTDPANLDKYSIAFSAKSYTTIFLPVLEHQFVNLSTLSHIFHTGPTPTYWGLVITSQRALESLHASIPIIPSAWLSLPTFVVGPLTARVASSLGFSPLGGAESGNASSLADFIISYLHTNPLPSPSAQLLFLTGDKRRDDLPHSLGAAGIRCDEITIYETRPRDKFPEELAVLWKKSGTEINWIVFFSPSGVDIVWEELRRLSGDRAKLATIGNTTGEYLKSKGVKVDVVAEKPIAESLVKAIVDFDEKT